MINIFLTTDPLTGRGLHDDESRFLGTFQSVLEAANQLGDIFRFCSIR